LYKNVLSWRLKAAGEETQRSGGGSLFHARGPAAAKDRSPSDDKRYCNVIKNCIMEPGIKATACACELLYVYVYVYV